MRARKARRAVKRARPENPAITRAMEILHDALEAKPLPKNKENRANRSHEPRRRYSVARYRAQHRGIPFTLTFEQYCAIISQPCVYGVRSESRPDILTGIDRRDSELGYTLENSQPCCARHNLAKSDIFTHEQMLAISHQYGIQCGNTRTTRKVVSVH
jgi:hypothetical protein